MQLPTILATAEVIWIVAMTVWLLLERRSPVATLAWIFGLALLPIVGLPFYYLIGPRRLQRKKIRYRGARKALRAALDTAESLRLSAVSEDISQLMTLGLRASHVPVSRAHSVDLLVNGRATFDAIVAAIEASEHHVNLEYYIFEPDHVGTRLRDALVARAKAGVEVRVLVDAIGSPRAGKAFFAPLLEAGGQVAWFNPVHLFRGRLLNFRTHRKIVVCDGVVGFTGGINVVDYHHEDHGKPAWRDTHVRLEGDAVRGLTATFFENWVFAHGRVGGDVSRFFPEAPAGNIPVQIFRSGPDEDEAAIHKLYFAAINAADDRVWITTPYLIPDESILTALITAVLRGVDVRVLVPKKGDSRLVGAASRSFYEELREHGVKIYEYEPSMIHAKTLVVDDEVAIVGTANMDNRSFRLNFEVTAAIYDPTTARALASLFTTDLEKAHPVRQRELRREPAWNRLLEAGARLLAPML
ncbi:MAG: cardiolipin synthase [Myxococcales bacterium]|nr:cardiolipin synthase [Myxococcales bacterium]